SCSIATLPAGTSASFTLTSQVPGGTTGVTYSNIATVTSASDPNVENNSSPAVTLVTGTVPTAAPVQYVYDELSRLIAAIDPSGNAAKYVYDPAGNTTQIVSLSAGTLGIIDF